MHHNRNQPYWPALKRNLHPSWPDEQCIKQRDGAEEKKQSFSYNWCHGARPLSQHQPGGIIRTKLEHQKSWTAPTVVTTEHAMLLHHPDAKGATPMQNQHHLEKVPAPQPDGLTLPVLPVCNDIYHEPGNASVRVHVGALFPLFQVVNLNHMNTSRECWRVPLNVENCYVFQYANCDLIAKRNLVTFWFCKCWHYKYININSIGDRLKVECSLLIFDENQTVYILRSA